MNEVIPEEGILSVSKSRRKVGLSIPATLEAPCISALVAHPLVHAVEHRPQYRALNWYARWGTEGRPVDETSPTGLVSNTLGLSGLGEIVGVADTGLCCLPSFCLSLRGICVNDEDFCLNIRFGL